MQFWKFYNIDRREEGDSEKYGLHQLHHFLFCKQGFLVRSITYPYHTPELTKGNLFRLNKKAYQPAHKKGLLSLPNELLLMILDLDKNDPLTLPAWAITCHRLFKLALEHGMIKDMLFDWAVPWAWCRIVCLGHYAQFEDVPKTLFTDAELATIVKSQETADRHLASMAYAGVHQLDLAEHHSVHFFGAHSFYDPTLFKDGVRELLGRFTPSDRARFHVLMGVTYPPDRKNWGLCNGDKREYVRASAIAKLAGRPDDPQPFLPNCRVDLGHALLTRIAWSSVRITDMSQNATTKKLHRGQWAGDCFFIAIMDWLDKEKDWTGVSEAVVHDLTEIYKAEYGERWSQEVEGETRKVDQFEWYWMRSDGHDDVAKQGRLTTKRRPMSLEDSVTQRIQAQEIRPDDDF